MQCHLRYRFFLLGFALLLQSAHAEIEYFYSGATGGLNAYANKLISYDTVSGNFSVVGPLSDQSLQPWFGVTGPLVRDLSNNTISFQACMQPAGNCFAPASYTTITIDAATGHTLSTAPNSGAASLLPSGTYCCYSTIPTISATTLASIARNTYLKVNSTGAAATASGSNSVAVGDGANAAGASSIAVGHNASAASTSAVAIGADSSATADNSVALGSGSVADEANTVSVGSSSNARRVTNVAAGAHPTDAANIAQMQAGLNQALTQANAYTDQQVAGLRNYVDRRANGGTAAAMALSGIPQPIGDGKVMIGIGYGNWRGSQGMAIGGVAIVGSKTVVKAGATFDDQGGKGFSGGVGLQF